MTTYRVDRGPWAGDPLTLLAHRLDGGPAQEAWDQWQRGWTACGLPIGGMRKLVMFDRSADLFDRCVGCWPAS